MIINYEVEALKGAEIVIFVLSKDRCITGYRAPESDFGDCTLGHFVLQLLF